MPYDDEEQEDAFPYTTIGTDEAKSMIDAGTRIIDVRQYYVSVQGDEFRAQTRIRQTV